MIADRSLRVPVERLLSTLLADSHADRPLQAPGLVRTFLSRCDGYSLPEDRLDALRGWCLARGSTTFFARVLHGWVGWQAAGDVSIEHTVPGPDNDHLSTPAAMIAHGWELRLFDLWWRGTWSLEEDLPCPTQLLEHVLIDGTGAWAIVLSPEDHGFLIADEATSREILTTWNTTPDAELAAQEADMAEFPRADDDVRWRVLAHARAGRWW